MRPSPVRLRALSVTVAVVAIAMLAPLVSAGAAVADAIGDKQAQARDIANQLAELQHQAEAQNEQYNQAVDRLDGLQVKVDDASRKATAANAELAKRRSEVTDYAIGDYVKGGNGGVLPLILNSNGADMGQRQGYANVAVGNREDLVNSLNAAKDDDEHQVAALAKAKADAQAAKDQVEQNRADTEAAVAKEQGLQNQVQGELATLVAQEQARQAEAQRQAAEEHARQQAEAARLAAPPAAPASLPAAPPTTAAPTTAAPTTEAPRGAAPTTAAPSTAAPTAAPTTTAPAPLPAPTPAPAPDPTPAPAPAPSGGGGGGGGAGVVASAQSVLGTPYVWGGDQPGGFDCSGLVEWAYAQNGRSVPRGATDQMHASRIIPLSDLQPGDLIFYDGDSSYVNHVAIYIGGGMIIHAPHTGDVVKVESMYFWDAIVAAGRP